MKSKITFFILVFNTVILSQPQISWIREYDTGSLDERGVSATETNDDNGYIICGYRSTPETIQDLFLIRTDEGGDTIWTKQYGVLNGSDYGMQILRTGDGYVIGGMTTDLSLYYFDAWLLKINEDGDTLWSKTLLDSARIKSICLSPDGGIAATGGKVFNGRNKLFIARFDPNGDLLWLNYYSRPYFYDSFGYDIDCTQDNGFAVLGGASDSNTPSIAEPWLLKTDGNGNAELDTVYNLYNQFYLIDGNIKQTESGDFILAEDMIGTISYLKINSSGEIENSLMLSNDELSPYIIQASDSNFICMYSTFFGSSDYCSIIFQKTDQNFNNIWTKEVSGNEHYFGYRFITTSNNSIVLTGWTQPPSTQNGNILLAKLEGDITPVELIAFQAGIEGNNVILNWKTATENNNYGFDIERSADRNYWEKIGFVKGNINSVISHTYSFVDSSSQSGTVYYMLKQIDLNGIVTYSNELKVELSPVVFALSQNYPNPLNPVTTINYSIPQSGRAKLEVYDILGQNVTTLVNEVKNPGNYSIEFNGSRYSTGVYIYTLTAGEGTISRKMLLIK